MAPKRAYRCNKWTFDKPFTLHYITNWGPLFWFQNKHCLKHPLEKDTLLLAYEIILIPKTTSTFRISVQRSSLPSKYLNRSSHMDQRGSGSLPS